MTKNTFETIQVGNYIAFDYGYKVLKGQVIGINDRYAGAKLLVKLTESKHPYQVGEELIIMCSDDIFVTTAPVWSEETEKAAPQKKNRSVKGFLRSFFSWDK